MQYKNSICISYLTQHFPGETVFKSSGSFSFISCFHFLILWVSYLKKKSNLYNPDSQKDCHSSSNKKTKDSGLTVWNAPRLTELWPFYHQELNCKPRSVLALERLTLWRIHLSPTSMISLPSPANLCLCNVFNTDFWAFPSFGSRLS